MRSRGPKRVADCTAGRGRSGTQVRAPDGLGKCRVLTICAHDRAPGEPPDGRTDSNTWPGCEPTWGAPHSTPADDRKDSAKKFLLRDHAPPQLRASAAVVAKWRRADGAPVAPGRAEL